MSDVRWAIVEGQPKVIQAYMPSNYKVVGFQETSDTIFTYIEGKDGLGWTLDEYVRPRLESGLYFGLTELYEDPFKDNNTQFPILPWPE